MKKLKLMALGLMFLMIQSAVAVTLPTTSYSPYAVGSSYGSDEGVVVSGGTRVQSSFLSLGEGEDKPFDDCIASTDRGQQARHNCCETAFNQCLTNCGDDLDCKDNCEARSESCPDAPSLPLDGGLSILLVLALGSGAVRVFRKK